MTIVLEAQCTNSQLALAGSTEAMRPERKLSDSFWMHTYKVELCPKKEFHDWEKCAYAHPGERARRRHPSKYQAVQCPEARAKKVCPRGMDCPCTHHLFEYWLHPDRYLTCLCELGQACNRPICFFAHTEDELRPLPPGLSVAAQPPAPASHKAQQNKTGSAASSNSTPTHSLVPHLVASFNQALAMQELRSSSASPAAAVSQVSGTGSDRSGHSSSAPTAPGSGVQLLIEQMASVDTLSSSNAFSALDDLAADKAGKHPAAVGSKSPTPLAIVVAAPSPSDLQRTSSSLASGSPPVLFNGSPPAGAVVGVAAGHTHPLQQLAQQQQPGRVLHWHCAYPAAATSSAGSSSGTLPVVPSSVQVQQANLQAHLRQLQHQNLLQYNNGASISCSSPLALANSSAMGLTLCPTLGSISPGSGVSPRSVTSDIQDVYALQQQQQQQQQQARGVMGVMNATGAVSQGNLVPGFLAQQQPQYVQVQPGGAGYAVISMPAVVQPQRPPQQVYDDPAEHLSFSLLGGDAVAACHPGVQHQLLQQNHNLGAQHCQQQQLQVLQQRQQLLQLLQQQQQQNLEQQFQLQQMQQVATAASAPALGGGVVGGMQSSLGVGVAMQPSLGGQFANQGVEPGSLMNGLAPTNTGLMISQGVSKMASPGFEGFQALNLPAQQQQQQVLLMPQLHQAFGANHSIH